MKKNKTKPTSKAKSVVEAEVSKPKWYIKPIAKDKVHHGCLNCGGTEQTLDLETRLYNSFGGWTITKDGELYFMDDRRDAKWEEWKQLKDFEKEARKDPDHDWRAEFNLPLRGGEYQRHAKNKWVLIKSNQGFA
jgi:hypothetical protein